MTGESPYGINFRLLVNGQPLLTCAPGPGWSLAACELPAGSQLLRWEGNNSTATAETTAWLDTIQTAPAAWFGWLRERERSLYTDPAADPDGDGFGSFDEFAYGSDPWSAASVFRPPLASFTTTGSQRYLSLTWRRGPGTSGLPFLAEYSPDLLTWRSDAAGIVPVSSIPNADGSVTETVRSAIPASVAPRRFLRVHPDGP